MLIETKIVSVPPQRESAEDEEKSPGDFLAEYLNQTGH